MHTSPCFIVDQSILFILTTVFLITIIFKIDSRNEKNICII